jgi:hypothetical protein
MDHSHAVQKRQGTGNFVHESSRIRFRIGSVIDQVLYETEKKNRKISLAETTVGHAKYDKERGERNKTVCESGCVDQWRCHNNGSKSHHRGVLSIRTSNISPPVTKSRMR